ncbi:alpha/beta fold hydrolase [Halobaculum sp. MBLA0147]|uniref:alpha/beta fold hydrolase n=1 Tax=Halobaculum sp. MBLA0147 TaxID=3079934 RepID=UPI0035239AF2
METQADHRETAPGRPATDATLASVASAESVWIETSDPDGVRLHAVAAGDPGDPLVVLLHGFPDFWYGWREQLEPLVDAGYRVVVPDQRGYNLSDAPDSVRAYRVERLSADVCDVIEWAGRESAHVVGHDWGAAVAWDLALRHPDRVDRLAVCNVPHPTVFGRTLRSNPRQMLRSWYVAAFQVPKLPEFGLGANDAAGLARVLDGSAHEGTFSDGDLDRYRAAWTGGPGGVSGMVNWYRAAARYGMDPPSERVAQPTLICWGEDDDALVPEMAAESLDFCVDGRLERYPSASHWVHLERASAVTAELRSHLDG